MNLTQLTDYSLRVLIYLGSTDDELVSTQQISDAYRISHNHLIKVVNKLGHLGYIELIRGRNGGMRLAMDAADINIAEVVKAVEPGFHIVECFNPEKRNCPIIPVCGLIPPIELAKNAFLGELAKYTLRDAIDGIDYSTHYHKASDK